MMRERLIALVNHTCETKSIHKEFSEKTGLSRSVIKNLLNGVQRFNEDHIRLITTAFPQYKMWFVFGQTQPETAQTSPELEEVAGSYGKTETDTQ